MATITGAQGQQLFILPGLASSSLTTVNAGQTIPPSTTSGQVLAILGGSGVPAGDKGSGSGQYSGIVVIGGSFVGGVFQPNGTVIVDPGVDMQVPAGGVAGFTGALSIDASSGHNTVTGGGNSMTVFGGNADSLVGGSGSNVFFSSSAETIVGGSGPNTVFGAAADTITGGSGSTVIHGATAEKITGGSGATTIFGASNDTITGGSGKTKIRSGGGEENITGGSGPTTIRGAAGDLIFGGSGKTKIHAEAGDQKVMGGAGNTTIFGGGGDRLQGGPGNTQIQLNFDGNQTITDRGTHGHSTAQETVTGFAAAEGNSIQFPRATEERISQVLASAKQVDYQGLTSTQITLPDGTKILLAGVAHIDGTIFS